MNASIFATRVFEYNNNKKLIIPSNGVAWQKNLKEEIKLWRIIEVWRAIEFNEAVTKKHMPIPTICLDYCSRAQLHHVRCVNRGERCLLYLNSAQWPFVSFNVNQTTVYGLMSQHKSSHSPSNCSAHNYYYWAVPIAMPIRQVCNLHIVYVMVKCVRSNPINSINHHWMNWRIIFSYNNLTRQSFLQSIAFSIFSSFGRGILCDIKKMCVWRSQKLKRKRYHSGALKSNRLNNSLETTYNRITWRARSVLINKIVEWKQCDK